MVYGIQRVFATMGTGACFLFCALDIACQVAGKYIDAYQEFLWANQMKVPGNGKTLQVVDDICYVNAPAIVMKHCTGMEWSYRWEPKDYRCQVNEWDLLRFEWTEAGTVKELVHKHFVRGDGLPIVEKGRGNVKFDPYQDSMTVRYGACVSKRVFGLL